MFINLFGSSHQDEDQTQQDVGNMNEDHEEELKGVDRTNEDYEEEVESQLITVSLTNDQDDNDNANEKNYDPISADDAIEVEHCMLAENKTEERRDSASVLLQELHQARAFRKTRKVDSLGSQHLSNNVFTITVISNRTMAIIIYAIYILFFVSFIHEVIFLSKDDDLLKWPIGIIDPTNETRFCWFDNSVHNQSYNQTPVQGECLPADPDIERDRGIANVTQAELMINTGIVSDGLNISNWEGTGAKSGTPPFKAFHDKGGTFLLGPAALDFDANPQLHYVWNDIKAMLYFGESSDNWLAEDRTYSYDLEMKKTNGEWPSDIENEPFKVRAESYVCLHGSNCTSIGSFRKAIINEKINNNPPRELVNGNTFTVRIFTFNHFTAYERWNSWGDRIAILSDPGGAISACISGDNCEANLIYSHQKVLPHGYVYLDLAVLIIYLLFFIWWVRTLIKFRGRNWATENKWLFVGGIGFWINVNAFDVTLKLLGLHGVILKNREQCAAAAMILSYFGQVLILFVVASFSDAPRRYVSSKFKFYSYKAAYCAIMWGASVITVLFTHPKTLGRDENGSDSEMGGLGYVTSPENWSSRDQLLFVVSFMIIVAGTIFGFVYYLWANNRSIRILSTVPYNMTRPMQLSSRFFFFVTFLLVLLEFLWLVLDFANAIAHTNVAYGYLDQLSTTSIALDSMYYSDELKPFNNNLFKCFFLIIFQCLFLPPSAFKLGDTSQTVTYYKTEEEAQEDCAQGNPTYRMVSERAKLLAICATEVYLPLTGEEREKLYPPVKEKKKGAIGKAVASVSKATTTATAKIGNAVTSTTDGIKVVAASARKGVNFVGTSDGKDSDNAKRTAADSSTSTSSVVSDNDARNNGNKEEIGPPPFLPEELDRLAGDPGSSPRLFPWEGSYAAGCRVVARIFEPDGIDLHESRAMIFRHTPTGDLIVSFRGTKTKKQIKTDLMAGKIDVAQDTFLVAATGVCCDCINRRDETNSPEELEEDKELTEESMMKRLRHILDKEDSIPDYLKGLYQTIDGTRGKCKLHFGFYSSYCRLRKEIHQKVQDELLETPGRLLITGHSLGGAQATHCAYDMARWVVPTVRRKLLTTKGRVEADRILLSCYTFGSPRTGGRKYRAAYNKAVPDTQRIVCDGDIITNVPPARLGFRHVGRENIIDIEGFVRVDPLLIERNFSRQRRDISAHATTNYRIAVQKSFSPVCHKEEILDTIREAYGKQRKNKSFSGQMRWAVPGANEASNNPGEDTDMSVAFANSSGENGFDVFYNNNGDTLDPGTKHLSDDIEDEKVNRF